ncbi:MAG: hypothetical protein VKJ64_12120 [Leptolyngbyaceae bacterium]|nr:hypothetical protein [Leptolyngbyaceae bacterium]
MNRSLVVTLSVAAILATGLTLSACQTLSSADPPVSPDPQPTQPVEAIANPWIGAVPDLEGSPWQAQPCDGSAPFLCVYHQQDWVGTVELQTWPLGNRTDLQTQLSAAGLDPAAINLDEGEQQTKVITALQALVAEYYATVEADISTGFDPVTFEAEAAVEVAVGTLPGLRYGFTTIDGEGKVQRQAVGYMAFDGQTLYAIATETPASEAPGFEAIEQFQEFQPYLATLMGNMQISRAEGNATRTSVTPFQANIALAVDTETGTCPATVEFQDELTGYEGGADHAVVVDFAAIAAEPPYPRLVGDRQVIYDAPLLAEYASCVGTAHTDEHRAYEFRFSNGEVVFELDLTQDDGDRQILDTEVVANRAHINWQATE